MANTIDPMDIKQIITLRIDGVSNRKIAETLDVSQNTINTYMQLIKACDRPIASPASKDLQSVYSDSIDISND